MTSAAQTARAYSADNSGGRSKMVAANARKYVIEILAAGIAF
jgi:hypothetical protein